MNRFQVRAALVPKPITWALMLSSCAVGAYWWITYSGLYRLLAELQLAHWHEYRPSYTGLLVMFATLIPSAMVIQIIGAVREQARSPEEAAAHAAEVAAAGNPVHTWLERHRGRAIALGMTIMFAVAGAYFFGTGTLAGARVPVDAGALEHGERPTGRYAELTGLLLPDDAVVMKEGSATEKIFLPVVSPEWKAGQPVRAYLEMDADATERHADELATRHYEGMLTANSLPGLVVSSLAGRGRPPSDRYWVLEYRQTPETKIWTGKFMLVAAAIAGVITAIAWAIAARRERNAV